MITQGQKQNKWFILAIITLVHLLVIGVIWTVLPVLFSSIAEDLGLSLTQIGVIWSMLPVGFVLFALPGGSLGDRFGFRKVIGIGCFLVALTNALIGISLNFITFVIFTLLCGISLSIVLPNLPKAAGLFFPKNQLGLANGILIAGFGIGGALTTAISISLVLPLVGSWRNVLFLYSGICIIVGIMWLLLIRETKPSQMPIETDTTAVRVPFRKSITTVLQVRDIWLLTMASLGYGAALISLEGYLPVYIESIGIAKNIGDTMVSTLYAGSILGAILIPAISDRIGLRKIVLLIGAGIMCICTYLFSILSNETALWLLIPLTGFIGQGIFALYLTVALEIRGVGIIYGGAAAGIVVTGADAGGVISPLIGGILAEIDQSWPFIFWAGMALLSLVGIFLIRETGRKRTS